MALDLSGIEALVMDVDGVLTDGTISLGDDGVERRRYHARDGIGMVLGRRAGLRFGIVTSSRSAGIAVRARRLGIEAVRIAVDDKEAALRELAAELDLQLGRIAFAGDDLVDLPAMAIAGVAIAVADAAAAVRAKADLVTENPGGRGAIREACELLIAARSPEVLAEAGECGLRL